MPSIAATRFNNLQARIQAVYGAATSLSSSTGYGQTVRSGQQGGLVENSHPFDAVADVNYSTDTINLPGHTIPNQAYLRYEANGNDPIVEGLNEFSHYYAKVIDANNIQLFLDKDLTTIMNLITDASGTHILYELQADEVTAEEHFDLYKDIVGARIHQVGSAFTIGNDAVVVSGDVYSDPYITNLENIMTDVENDRFLIADPGQVSEEFLADGTGTPINSTRTSAWNGTIAHTFNMTFPTQGQQTGYWNAAGEIIFTPSLTGGSGTKTGDWRSMLSGVGVITFSRTGVSITGTANTVSPTITPYNLTTSNQVLVERYGASYANNRFRLYARRVSNNQLSFRVEFADLDSPGGFGIDENVNGTISSTVELYRPEGTMTINGVVYPTVNFNVTGLNTTTL